jgi:O-antigen ligase
MTPATTARRDRVVLVLLQLGVVAIVLASAPYKAFDLDRYFVPKELVLNACAALTTLLLLGGRKRLTFTAADLLLAAFLFAGTLSAIMATNSWAAERALAISFSGAALFWVTSTLRREGLVRSLVAALAFGVVLGAAMSLAQAYGVDSEYFSLNRAPGGTFGNRNFVAHLSAIGLPVLVLSALTARRGVHSLLGGIGVAVVSAALVMSRSRAAWLAILCMTIPVGVLALLTWQRWCEQRTKRRLVVLGLAMAAGAAAAVFLPNRLEWRSENPYLESATGLVNYREGSGRGRLVQYTNSLRMVMAHPLLGVGPGNWPVAYPKYAVRNDPSMSQEDGLTSNPWPSSDWVAFLAERGVVGFAPLVLVILVLLGRAWRELRAKEGHNPERVLTALALIGTVVATAVVGAFDAVLLIAVPTFFFWTLAGALSPPVAGRFHVEAGVRQFAPVIVFGLSVIAVGRSAAQLAAITIAGTSTRSASLENASTLDPGSYRIHVRVAKLFIARGDCRLAFHHSMAARELFPNAGEPRRLLRVCGGR